MKTMRLILMNIFLFIGLGLSAQKIASATSEKAIKDGISSGVLTFTFPAELGSEEINKVASYYEQYFTVEFSENTHQLTIKLVENDARSRMVVMRFFTANGIEKILVGTKELTIDEFNTLYLK